MKKKSIQNIKSKLVGRSFSLARTGMKAAQLAASRALKSTFSDEKDLVWRQYLVKQAELLAMDFGQLKGSVMKVGQLLSTYGEHFLPSEANDWLKSLQNQSPPLVWEEIKKVVDRELPLDKLQLLEIDPEPLAAASLGQVHLATVKATGQKIALKIQYPGVDEAIKTDMKFLRSILAISSLAPKGPQWDSIFDEVQDMLKQEVDYNKELKMISEMEMKLADSSQYKVAKPLSEFCSQKILATELIIGFSIDDPLIRNMSQIDRNKIGELFLNLYLRELIELRLVQTDPHFGNFKIIVRPNEEIKIGLFDFGATRQVPDNYLNPFMKVLEGGISRNEELIIAGGTALKLIFPDDPPALKKLYIELCFLITEPFENIEYNWGESDLPKRVALKGAEVIKNFHLRAPPRETVFLDRKLGGIFTILSKLDCIANWRPLILKYLELHKSQLAKQKSN